MQKLFLIKRDQLIGRNIHKLENLQKTGSFKARGALNKILNINSTEKVVAASSGNHGAAVSYALSQKNMVGTIYVPKNVKKSKVKPNNKSKDTILQGSDLFL